MSIQDDNMPKNYLEKEIRLRCCCVFLLIEVEMDQAEVASEMWIVGQPRLWRSETNIPTSK